MRRGDQQRGGDHGLGRAPPSHGGQQQEVDGQQRGDQRRGELPRRGFAGRAAGQRQLEEVPIAHPQHHQAGPRQQGLGAARAARSCRLAGHR
jgi:hypothetical protein